MTGLSEAIKGSRFAVTAEVTPPCSPDPQRIKAVASHLKGKVHGVVLEENVDGVHMSSIVSAIHLKSAGVDPVMTMLTRDGNRIGLQSALLGAVSMGIGSVLVLSGHHQALTAETQARGVYDVDSIQAINIFRAMRDEGLLASGQRIEMPISFSIGAAANPFAGPIELRVLRAEKKVKAGADFIITEPVFDLSRFREWLKLVGEKGVPDRACLMAGIMWLKSAEEAKNLSETYRGMNIPEAVIRRLSDAPDGEREGLLIAAEMIEQVRSLNGAKGIHLWARGREESLPELLDYAKISVS